MAAEHRPDASTEARAPDEGFPDAGAGRVLVAGSINLDMVITAPRHPNVGETLIASAVEYHPGGKGSNQAVAAARAGARTEFIGAVGDDAAGRQLRDFLEREGVGVEHLRSLPATDSGLAVVMVAAGDNAVLVVSGANARFHPDATAAVPIGPGDVLVSQFEIAEATVRAFFERGKSVGARTVLNPSPSRPLADALWSLADVIVVNEIELQALCELRGLTGASEPPPARARALIAHDRQTIVVTLGAAGCAVASRDQTTSISGHAVKALDTTGAGDCFLGYLAAQLLRGEELVRAAWLANVAGSLCVQRMGASSSIPALGEVLAVADALGA